ncbi:MAG: phosphate/phosphite/phosphonate ABC transporter substrate-binding protein [Spirulinaceae cyanobacterium RM2_2_10]|nr:phosphate/phosphite/phosphonate ABC transporter substrate-binding protein [Spirulinaceae cyanobacterium SM2_1_0]NJO21505.1 phosphate/phosphite/phosphonate ABC transporter substrate-binding protein [Spirulinaceae cyanobacterium RM2_2_10]
MTVRRWFQYLILGCLSLVLAVACTTSPATDDAAELTELRFGVGPYFPTPNETSDQFVPFFEYLAASVGLEADVTVTEDWVGISEALRAGTLDVAWLGPWGYVLANHETPEIQAIATVKYKDEPTYFSVLMARADAPFETLDEAIEQSQAADAPLKISLADVGSTSGWLVPTAEFERRGLDPKQVFEYNEGASHAAQAIAVLSEQVDIASDFDRNLDVLDSTERIDKDELKIIWESEPLPNDPIAVRGGLPEEIIAGLQAALEGIDAAKAEELLPENYTGFVSSDGSNYEPIQAAGQAVGKLE